MLARKNLNTWLTIIFKSESPQQIPSVKSNLWEIFIPSLLVWVVDEFPAILLNWAGVSICIPYCRNSWSPTPWSLIFSWHWIPFTLLLKNWSPETYKPKWHVLSGSSLFSVQSYQTVLAADNSPLRCHHILRTGQQACRNTWCSAIPRGTAKVLVLELSTHARQFWIRTLLRFSSTKKQNVKCS